MNLKYPDLQDSNWLYHQYVILNKSACVISGELKCDHQTVLNAMYKLGIKIRSKTEARAKYIKYPLLMNRDYLYDQYIVKNKSTENIARNLGCSNGAVWDALKRHKIPLRTLKETTKGEKNSFYGKKHTQEAKNKISNRDISIETRKKLSKSHKGLQVGEKNGSWKGGISFLPYCPKFNSLLKEKIRDRDSRKCQLCPCTEEENGRKLDVHHIHYDKPNCNADLISVCKRCNAIVNFNRDYYESFFMEKLRIKGIV